MGNQGRFVWYELLTTNPDAAVAFYGEAVGWKTEPFGPDGYRMWVGSQGPLGGVMRLPDEAAKMGAPSHWMSHVQVASVDESVALATSLGAKVHVPPQDIPTVGRFSVIADPQGAVLSLFTPAGDMKLHDLQAEGEFCWNELITSDLDAATAFYGELLGWKKVDEMDMGPMGTYRLFGVGDTMLGGVMKIPPGAPMPPSWVYYVETKDLAAAIGRCTRNGATLLVGPMEIPGGSFAQLLDPQGAAFALHQARPNAT